MNIMMKIDETCYEMEAIKWVIVHHHGQVRGSGDKSEPYAMHCIRVADTVRKVLRGRDIQAFEEATYVSALLHDIVEDTIVTYEDILEQFGQLVADTVETLTLPDPQPKGKEKMQHQIEVMADPVTTNLARIIKFVDKYDNCQSMITVPPSWGKKAVLGYFETSLSVMKTCIETLTGEYRTLDYDLQRMWVATRNTRDVFIGRYA